jgi:hypothetical protein
MHTTRHQGASADLIRDGDGYDFDSLRCSDTYLTSPQNTVLRGEHENEKLPQRAAVPENY